MKDIYIPQVQEKILISFPNDTDLSTVQGIVIDKTKSKELIIRIQPGDIVKALFSLRKGRKNLWVIELVSPPEKINEYIYKEITIEPFPLSIDFILDLEKEEKGIL